MTHLPSPTHKKKQQQQQRMNITSIQSQCMRWKGKHTKTLTKPEVKISSE